MNLEETIRHKTLAGVDESNDYAQNDYINCNYTDF
jgi:hypothetical protein